MHHTYYIFKVFLLVLNCNLHASTQSYPERCGMRYSRVYYHSCNNTTIQKYLALLLCLCTQFVMLQLPRKGVTHIHECYTHLFMRCAICALWVQQLYARVGTQLPFWKSITHNRTYAYPLQTRRCVPPGRKYNRSTIYMSNVSRGSYVCLVTNFSFFCLVCLRSVNVVTLGKVCRDAGVFITNTELLYFYYPPLTCYGSVIRIYNTRVYMYFNIVWGHLSCVNDKHQHSTQINKHTQYNSPAQNVLNLVGYNPTFTTVCHDMVILRIFIIHHQTCNITVHGSFCRCTCTQKNKKPGVNGLTPPR